MEGGQEDRVGWESGDSKMLLKLGETNMPVTNQGPFLSGLPSGKFVMKPARDRSPAAATELTL